jgi:hypothetical protein
MSREFSALLWMERHAIGKSILIVPFVGASLFSRWVPDPYVKAQIDAVGNTKVVLLLLVVYALITGYQQTARESSPDMRAFARHRAATSRQLFGAKLLAGGGSLLFAMLGAGVPTMWALLLLRDLQVDTTLFLAAVAESLSVLSWYAAGLNQGTPAGRGVRGYLGIGIAGCGSFAVAWTRNTRPVVGIGVSLALTLVVTAMAWLASTSSAEFESEPQAGRAVT